MSFISLLICAIGVFNYVGHILPFAKKVRLKTLVDVVKDNSFPSQAVDLISKHFIAEDWLVELLRRLFQTVL